LEKILEGDVARFEVPDLLTFLNMGRRTGVLVMERATQETKIFFRDGQPIFSTSSRDELRLLSLLERQGRADAKQLAALGPRLQFPAGAEAIGTALVAEKLVSTDELATFLKVQVSEVIFDTFEWGEGVFTFFDGIPPPATAVTIEIDLQNLMMEGVRRIDERGRLEELFPDRELVVEAVANPERVKNSVTLTGEEWRVFFLVDGRRSVDEIVSLAGEADEAATLQVLHNLIAANLVSLVAPAPAPAPDPAVATALPAAKTSDTDPGRKKTPARPAPAPPARRARAAPRSPTARASRVAEEGGSGPVSVEYNTGPLARQTSHDTRQIVDPRAAPYLDNARRMSVARLVLKTTGKEDRSFPMSRDSSTLGRHRNNDIVITDPKVSSFHARIDRTTEGHVLVDLGSRNGSFVNGRRVSNQALANGDELRVGTAKLNYQIDFTTPA
jgi:hypothetical protein